MTMTDILMQQLGGNAGAVIADRLGVDEATANQAIQVALPMLVTALSQNAASADGATSLHNALAKDHDGGILDNLTDFMAQGGNLSDGTAILGHVLGRRKAQEAVVGGVSEHTGVSSDLLMQLLPLLAPIVMAYLGRQQRTQGFDPGSLTGYLEKEKAQIEALPLPKAPTKPADGLTGMLDQDGDGSLMGEATQMGMSILGRLLGKRQSGS